MLSGQYDGSDRDHFFQGMMEKPATPPKPAQQLLAVTMVAGAYVFALHDRMAAYPHAFEGFGFHPEAFARASQATQVHVVAGIVGVVLGLLQLALPKGTARHRGLGYVWVTAMLALCASAMFVKDGVGLLQLLAVVVTGLLVRAIWFARTHQVARHAHLMQVLVLGATVGVGLFTALPGRVTWSIFFAG